MEGHGDVEKGAAGGSLDEGSRSRGAASPTATSARPRGSGGLWGLLRGWLQRLRGWGRGLLGGYGPLVPGERLLLLRRLGKGAAYGAVVKAVITSRSSYRKVSSQPLAAIVGYLRPFKVTLGLMVAGAGMNAVLFYFQLRYHTTDLSVVPPETRWQQALRALFGPRPPAGGAAGAGGGGAVPAARGSPPRSPRRLPPIDEKKPALPAAAGVPAAAAAAAAPGAGPTPAASPAVGSLLPGSPALSFVDVAGSPQRPPLAAAQEGPWSDVPLGGTHTASSTPEDWTEVGRSGTGSPQPSPGHSPTAAAAAAAAAAEGQEGKWMAYEHVEQGAEGPGEQ